MPTLATPTTAATWLPPVPSTAATVEPLLTSTESYTLQLARLLSLNDTIPTEAAETLDALPSAVAITMLPVAASVTDVAVTTLGDRAVCAAKPTDATDELPVYAPAPPIDRTLLPCASTVTFVAVSAVTMVLVDGATDKMAAPIAATADCAVPPPLARTVELHAPISTFDIDIVAVVEASASATPPAHTADHGFGPPDADTVLLPPIAIVTFDKDANAVTDANTVTPTLAAEAIVLALVVRPLTVLTFAELAIMFTFATLAHALPDTDVATNPAAATALL